MAIEHQASRRGRPSAQDTGMHLGDDELAVRLSDLARSLQEADDLDDALPRIVQSAIDMIPGAEEGSVSAVVGRSEVKPTAASGELPRQVDALMTEVGEGPCLDAIYDQHTVRVPDLSAELRWPLFCRRAVELGAASMLAFQLYVEGDNLGALNLYSTVPDAFTDESEHIGLLFATHAAIAYAGAQRQVQLGRGMATRDLIGQAKGILMERYGLTGDKAFGVLVRFSQERNLKLYDVAQHLVARREADSSIAKPT